MDIVIIGNPENRRVYAFVEAANKITSGNVIVVPYIDWLQGRPIPAITPGSLIRIESPGENAVVRKLLIERGSNIRLPNIQEPGVIEHLRSWYLGYAGLLQEIRERFPANSFRYMNAVDDILLMFDKCACQVYLQEQNIPVPRILTGINRYSTLVQKMQEQKLGSVFIKPAHSSSASGVIAFRKSGAKVQAISSAAISWMPGGLELFNSLKVHTYKRELDITALINTILAEHAQVEEWLPKATLQDRYFDLRVLVIAGRARHIVIRTSKQIITNLHLGNKRGDRQAFLDTFGAEKLQAVQQLAEQTAACFPNSLYMGIDILLTAGKATPYVLEVNAFGDLLPNLLNENESCYEAELRAVYNTKEVKTC